MNTSSSSRPTAGKDVDLEIFLLKFLDLILNQEVPKLFSQQDLRGLVDKTTVQQRKVQQFETNTRQRLGNFSVKNRRPDNSSGNSVKQQRHLATNTTGSAARVNWVPGSAGSRDTR
jgi:hypothetical protein